MNSMRGSEGCRLAVSLIETQLQALAASVAVASQAAVSSSLESDVTASFATLKSKRRSHDTGSGGNIVRDESQGDGDPAFNARSNTPRQLPLRDDDYLRIVISNALLVVRLFLSKHGMGNMRTPEIQFLGHVCDAILNGNIFDIDPGYIPIATFDGLTVNSALTGTPLFGDGVTDGIMEFGDAIALLQWLSHFLNGGRHFVTGGDAG